MAYPSDLPTVTVRHRIVGTDGTPARGGGRVTAVLTGRLWTGQGSVVPTQYTATVQEDGTYELELPPVDHPDIVAGRGEAYLVTEPAATIDTRRPGRVATQEYHVAPVTEMVGQTVDVSDVLVNKPKPGGGVERVTITGPATDESLAGIIADPSSQTAVTLKDTIATGVVEPAQTAAAAYLASEPGVKDAAAQAAAPAVDDYISTQPVAHSTALAGTNTDTRLWEPPAQPAGPDLTTWGAEKVINDLWEPLRAADPTYVTRQIIGYGAGSPHPIYAYHFTPHSYGNTILLTVEHGGEKIGMYALAKMMDLVVNHWNDHPALAALRARTRLVIVPVVSPWAVDNHSRTNANGVDLNRNWDYKWAEYDSGGPGSPTYKGTAPFSEPETQALRELALTLEAQGGLVAAIDVHDTGATQKEDPHYFYVGVPDRALPGGGTWLRELAQQMGAGPDRRAQISLSDHPKFANWFQARGIRSATLEYEQSWGTVGMDATNQTAALRWIGNAVLRASQLRAVPLMPSEPWAATLTFNSGTVTITAPHLGSGLGEEATDLRFEFIAPAAGFVEFYGDVMFTNGDNRVYLTPSVGQNGTGSGSGWASTSYHQRYADIVGTGAIVVPFSTASGVVESATSPVRCTLYIRARDKIAYLTRLRAVIKFTPATNPDRFMLYSATSGGGFQVERTL